MTTRTILITGGAGFIGSRLAGELSDSDTEIVLVDSLHPQVHEGGWPDNVPADARTLPFDVTVPSQWDALFKSVRPDVVVHLAAETGTGQSLRESSRHGRVNVVGTTELLDGLSRAEIVPERIVLASSRAVYGEGRWQAESGEVFYAPARDLQQLDSAKWDPTAPDGSTAVSPLPHRARETEPRPSNVYAATKLAQEHILAAWAGAFGSPLSVLRLQNVYGPCQSLSNPYTGIVSLFARLALAGESIPVYEDGGIVRDFVFIDDVVAALAAAARSTTPGHSTVDIGSGEALTLLEVANEIAGQAGAAEPRVTGQYRLGDVRAASADVTDAGELLGYVPQVRAREGVRRLLEWIPSVLGS